MIAGFGGGNPHVGIDIGVAGSRTIAVIGVEVVPVGIKTITEHEQYASRNSSDIGIGAVTIVGHLHAIAWLPVIKWAGTHDVHCCIGIEANENNQH